MRCGWEHCFTRGFGPSMFSLAIDEETSTNNISLSISMAPLAQQLMKEKTIAIYKGEQLEY